MKKLDVLLLGWEFPPLSEGDSGIACYEMAKELATQVNLSLILPKTDPEYVLNNVDLTGLNNIDLQATQTPVSKPAAFNTFAEPTVAPSEIPLYGAPTHTGQEKISVPAVEYPGEAASVGEMGEVTATSQANEKTIGKVEELNIFGQTDLSQIDTNSQVIHYARYATRLASAKSFDVIYAYDWMTYLAGIELKLVSGKLLVLHVQSLSNERGGPDHKGWVYEVEKQAMEKADFIIAESEEISDKIAAEYGVADLKIRSIKNLEEPLPFEINDAPEPDTTPAAESAAPVTDGGTGILPATSPEPLNWEEAASNIVSILHKLLETSHVSAR